MASSPDDTGHLLNQHEGKQERLSYQVQKRGERTSLLSIQPETGRKHQIRRQLSELGHPIVGDLRYGANTPLGNKQIALFATALEFRHPATKEAMQFSAELPEWWPELR
jgi:23S rRNA-/tRNA-specific pseudouridylate synthase